MENVGFVDELSEKVEVTSFVDRDIIIKNDVTDEIEVIFPANSLPIVVDHRHEVSPSGTSRSR